MLSGITKQQVVRCASLSVSAHQHQLAPNMTIADKTHITCYIKVRVHFQVMAYQSLYTTLWHFQNCCCHLCLLITLMYPDLSLWALNAQVDPTCMVTLDGDDWFQITGLHKGPLTSPQWPVQDTNRHIDSIQKPMSTIRFCMHVPETL